MRGRSWLTTLVVVALVATVGGWLGGRWMLSPREVAARSQPPSATVITAEVVSARIESTVVSRGTVRAVDVIRVGPGMLLPNAQDSDGAVSEDGGDAAGGGESVLTGVFASIGDEVVEGVVVVEVDGRPVIVLKGRRAAYRDIKPQMSGPDVAQLQGSLARLGYFAAAETGVFDAGTQAALVRLYRSLGYEPPSTDGGDGSDSTAIRTARDALNDAEVALAEVKDQRSKAYAALAKQRKEWEKARRRAPAEAGPRPVYEGPSEFDVSKAEEGVTRARMAWQLEVSQRGTMVPRSEVVFVPRLPASITQVGRGTGYAPTSPLFTLTPSAMVLASDVSTSQAAFLHEGDEAEVELPDGVVTGTIESITDMQEPGRVRVEISTPDPVPFSLAGADLKVTFLAAATPDEVLAVPQGAINSAPSGELSVIVQQADQSLVRVPVTVGVTGDNLVEVTPKNADALHAGDEVVIGG